MKYSVTALFLAAVLIAGGAEEGWKGKIGLGLDASRGNSEVTAMTLDVEAGYASGVNKYLLTGTYGYAETDGELSRQNGRVALNYDRTLSEMTYLYVRAEDEYDKIAKIDYRVIAGPGVGVYLLKQEGLSLKCDAGVSYVDQKLRDEDLENTKDGVTALRVTERFDVKISDTATAWQSLEYIPNADELDSYLLNLEIGLETKITGTTSLRMVAESRRDNTSPDGVEAEDVSLKAAIAYSFGG